VTLHRQWCPGGLLARYTCRCGRTELGICMGCGHVMWMHCKPGAGCEHAVQLGPADPADEDVPLRAAPALPRAALKLKS
jgi:hypothetical protein